VVDAFSRECAALLARKQFRGEDVVEELSRVQAERGLPQVISVDNGSEFTSRALDHWAYWNQVKLDFSRPGKPTDNAHVEAFHASLRRECLSQHCFVDLQDAQQTLDTWREDYNNHRPHSSLGQLPPVHFRKRRALHSHPPEASNLTPLVDQSWGADHGSSGAFTLSNLAIKVMPQKEKQMLEHKILFLGPNDSSLLTWLQEQGENVFQTSEALTPQFVDDNAFTFLVSYGYRHILRRPILDRFPNRAINLHISYLPWNRGADPNFWSFIEDTPKGVTIHYLDEGIDTGDICVQQEVEIDSKIDTLATSYQKLHSRIQDLFEHHWSAIKAGTCQRQKQAGRGSLHKLKDKASLAHLLTSGWETPVSMLEEYAAETRISKQFWEKYNSEIENLG
jgi:methionyl-tRNA formyltransferase